MWMGGGREGFPLVSNIYSILIQYLLTENVRYTLFVIRKIHLFYAFIYFFIYTYTRLD